MPQKGIFVMGFLRGMPLKRRFGGRASKKYNKDMGFQAADKAPHVILRVQST